VEDIPEAKIRAVKAMRPALLATNVALRVKGL
jgi:hypothetical protein